MKRLGYIRVSTSEQRPDRQIDGLQALCDELFVEYVSAGKKQRPIFESCINALEQGDHLLVWDLDRAFRSVVDALQTLEKLRAQGIILNIVNMNLDTSTPSGMLVYTVLSAFAEFERRVLSQRTNEGLAAAKKRSVRLGGKPKMTDDQIEQARARLQSGQTTRRKLAIQYKMHPFSITRAIKRWEAAHLTNADPHCEKEEA